MRKAVIVICILTALAVAGEITWYYLSSKTAPCPAGQTWTQIGTITVNGVPVPQWGCL